MKYIYHKTVSIPSDIFFISIKKIFSYLILIFLLFQLTIWHPCSIRTYYLLFNAATAALLHGDCDVHSPYSTESTFWLNSAARFLLRKARAGSFPITAACKTGSTMGVYHRWCDVSLSPPTTGSRGSGLASDGQADSLIQRKRACLRCWRLVDDLSFGLFISLCVWLWLIPFLGKVLEPPVHYLGYFPILYVSVYFPIWTSWGYE